jgi:hypothetical protein
MDSLRSAAFFEKIKLFLLPAAFVGAMFGFAPEIYGQASNAPARLRFEEPKFLQADIYSADRKQVLFRFTRRATRTNNSLDVVRKYTYPDGKVAALERVIYNGDMLVSYTLEDLQSGASGSAIIKRSSNGQEGIAFEYRKDPGAKQKSANEELVPDTILADMLAPFVVSHWKALMLGEKVKCRYIVVMRRETVGFTFLKCAESIKDGKPVVTIKMEPSSAIIGALIDPLFFTMEKDAPHHILEYSGRTTPKVREGNSWKNLDGVTVFDWKTGSKP